MFFCNVLCKGVLLAVRHRLTVSLDLTDILAAGQLRNFNTPVSQGMAQVICCCTGYIADGVKSQFFQVLLGYRPDPPDAPNRQGFEKALHLAGRHLKQAIGFGGGACDFCDHLDRSNADGNWQRHLLMNLLA